MTIAELNPSQEAQIPEYREKWREIAVSTQRLDRTGASEAIRAAIMSLLVKKSLLFYCVLAPTKL